MWYNSTPALVDLGTWLQDCLELFNDTFFAVYAVPVLGFFLDTVIFFLIFGLLALLIRQGRRGRL